MQLNPNRKLPDAATGTLQKMIVESGSVTMQLDLNRLNGTRFPGKTDNTAICRRSQFFFPILVFNDLLRGPEPGSMALIPAGVNASGYTIFLPRLARLSSSS